MLTQCSQCKKNYSLSIEELRLCSTELFCSHCDEMLGKLRLFKSDFFVNNKVNHHSYFSTWLIGIFICLGLFLAQLYALKGDKLGQNPEQRIWLEKICQALSCHLPVYKNLDEFEILQGDFQLKKNHYEFQTVLSNQAQFKQYYPRIKLVLLDFSGQIFAQRIFYPREYLGFEPTQLMPAFETIEVNLKIALPTQKVGGYTFELI